MGIYKPAYDGNYKDTLGHGFFVPGVSNLETFFANLQPHTVPSRRSLHHLVDNRCLKTIACHVGLDIL
jgi:hypothetical protein